MPVLDSVSGGAGPSRTEVGTLSSSEEQRERDLAVVEQGLKDLKEGFCKDVCNSLKEIKDSLSSIERREDIRDQRCEQHTQTMAVHDRVLFGNGTPGVVSRLQAIEIERTAEKKAEEKYGKREQTGTTSRLVIISILVSSLIGAAGVLVHIVRLAMGGG